MFPFDFPLKTEVLIVNLLPIFLVTNAMTDTDAVNCTDLTDTQPNDLITKFGRKTDNSAKTGLTVLTNETFYSYIAKGSHFVLFYEPWCKNTKRFNPTWEKLAKYRKFGDVSFAKFNCQFNKAICKEFGIRGYPTLIWIEDGKKVERYNGRKKSMDLKQYVKQMKHQKLKLEEGDDGQSKEEPVQQIQICPFLCL